MDFEIPNLDSKDKASQGALNYWGKREGELRFQKILSKIHEDDSALKWAEQKEEILMNLNVVMNVLKNHHLSTSVKENLVALLKISLLKVEEIC